MVLQVDFAENYTAAYQDEIQSAHWNQKQVTIFTSVAWSDADPLSYVVVSDSLDHDKKALATFLVRAVQNICQKHPHLRQIHIFSDGAASQFKNKYLWAFLSSSFQDMFPNLHVEWHFFATSHGKGAVDDVGGTVKRAVSTAVLSRQERVHTAADFAQVAAQRSQLKRWLLRRLRPSQTHRSWRPSGKMCPPFMAHRQSIMLRLCHGE